MGSECSAACTGCDGEDQEYSMQRENQSKPEAKTIKDFRTNVVNDYQKETLKLNSVCRI